MQGDVKSLLNPMTGRNLAETLADKINAKLGYTAPVPSLMSLDVGLGVPEPIEGSSGGAPTANRYISFNNRSCVVNSNEYISKWKLNYAIFQDTSWNWRSMTFRKPLAGA